MKRVLVLGGGGNVGIAWETAVVKGLLEAGVDVRKADLIVGTSAGSVVGSHLAHGRSPDEIAALQREAAARRAAAADGEGPLPSGPADPSEALGLFTLWSSFSDMTPEACAQVGRLALNVKTMTEERWLEAFRANVWPGWPQKPLLVTAVDCETGELHTFDANHGVPIERAVAASCAVPGLFPPVTIDGRRYMDGGVRSGTSADLAQRIEPDVVLIVAPMGASDRGIGVLAAKQIAREKGELEAAGVKVQLVRFDDAAKEAAGPNLMDPTRAAATAAAGEARARRLADELRAAWS